MKVFFCPKSDSASEVEILQQCPYPKMVNYPVQLIALAFPVMIAISLSFLCKLMGRGFGFFR